MIPWLSARTSTEPASLRSSWKATSGRTSCARRASTRNSGRSLRSTQIGNERLKLDACTRQRPSIGIHDPDNPRDARFECQITVYSPSVHGCVDLRQYIEMSQHSVRNDRQVIDCRSKLRQAAARQVSRASSDIDGGDQSATGKSDHAIRSIGFGRIATPKVRTVEARCVGNVRVVAVGVVFDERLERLPRLLIGDATFDHDAAFQADIKRHRIDPRRIRDFDARCQIRLSLGRHGNDVIAVSFGQTDQSITALTVRRRLNASKSVDGKLGRLIGCNANAGQRLAPVSLSLTTPITTLVGAAA